MSGLPTSGGIEEDTWELYRLADDFSQARDLAESHQDKVREMQSLFDAEARANQVHPIGFDYHEHPSPYGRRTTRTDYVYHEGFPSTPSTAPTLPDLGKSHRMSAELSLRAGAEGVIVANGGRNGGFVWYLQDGRIVYESNRDGRWRSSIVSTELVLSANHVVAFTLRYVDRDSRREAELRLFLDGRLVGEDRISHPQPESIGDDNFDIGQDSGSAVSLSYRAPFRLNVRIHSVRVRVDPTPPVDQRRR